MTENQRIRQLLRIASRAASKVQTGQMRGAAVPEGWKLVPVEPTDSQIDAGQEFLLPGVGARPGPVSVQVTTASFIGLYAAMLAAAPEVPK